MPRLQTSNMVRPFKVSHLVLSKPFSQPKSNFKKPYAPNKDSETYREFVAVCSVLVHSKFQKTLRPSVLLTWTCATSWKCRLRMRIVRFPPESGYVISCCAENPASKHKRKYNAHALTTSIKTTQFDYSSVSFTDYYFSLTPHTTCI